MQFHESYFKEFNDLLSPHFVFSQENQMIGIDQPIRLSTKDRNRLLSYIWKMDANRIFTLAYYQIVDKNIRELQVK